MRIHRYDRKRAGAIKFVVRTEDGSTKRTIHLAGGVMGTIEHQIRNAKSKVKIRSLHLDQVFLKALTHTQTRVS